MTAMIGWVDHGLDATISTSGTELIDVSNLLLQDAPSRGRITDAGSAWVLSVDLGSAKRLDAICMMGINARAGWSIGVSLGLSAPGDIGAAANTGGTYTCEARALPYGASAIIALTAATTCRYITLTCDWDTDGDGYFEARRLIPLECLRLRGVSIDSSQVGASRNLAEPSDEQTVALAPGRAYRQWSVVLRNLTLADLYGDDADPGALVDLQMLAAAQSAEVLLIPRTDNAHMLYRTAIVGYLTAGVQIPGRARGNTTSQFATFTLHERLY